MGSPWDEYVRSPLEEDDASPAEEGKNPPIDWRYYHHLLSKAGSGWNPSGSDQNYEDSRGGLLTYDTSSNLNTRTAQPNTITIGGQTYTGHDNGHANVLVPNTYVTNSPGFDVGEAMRSGNRVSFMADHPLGASAYGVASMFGAPEWARDLSLVAGGAVDTLLFSAAPYAMRGEPAGPLSADTGAPPVRQSMRTYGDLDEYGRPTGASAWVTPDTLGTGTKSDRGLSPPGWAGNGREYNQARAHLLPDSLAETVTIAQIL